MLWFIGAVLLTALFALYIKPKDTDTHKHLYRWLRNKVQVKESVRDELEWEFERLGMDDTPEDVKARQWLLAGAAFILFALLALVFWQPMWLLLGVGVSGFFYAFPMLYVNKAIREKEEGIFAELPDFIDLIILLMRAGLIPYEAIKQAVSQTKFKALQPDLERLSVDLDTMDTEQALERFACYVGIVEARQFVRAIWQAAATDRQHADEIFQNQSEVMRQLRQQRMRKIIKEKPLKVRFVSMGIFALILAIPLGVFAINFIQIFSSF
ncbi:MAG: hypothetical protein LOD88_13680 [Novibacillus thermophilus]